MQSVNNAGAVYAVSGRGCTCPNGAAGRQTCWHIALLNLMAEDRAAARDILADAAAYRAEIEAEGGDTPPTPPMPITLTQTPDGLVLTHGNEAHVARDAAALASVISQLDHPPGGGHAAAARQPASSGL